MTGQVHNRLIFLILLFSGAIASSCESNRKQIIPYVQVHVDLDLYAELGTLGIGSTMVIPNEGYHGIVLYREDDMLFHAYDMTCTEYPEHDAAVVRDTIFDGVYRCPECNSRYVIINGAYPDSGPAEFPLVEYRTTIQGNLLLITN
jgi:hypothetical protein